VKHNVFVVDTRNCVGCLACEIACKQEHSTDAGAAWIRVRKEDPREIEGRLRLRYDVEYCLHCTNPSCKDACPVDAITKRDDGAVLIDEKACIGCSACVDACSLGMMQFDEKKGLAQKCDLCVSRTNRGLLPACAAACISHCIYFGDMAEITARAPELIKLLKDKDVAG